MLQLRKYIEPEFSVENLAGYAEQMWQLSERMFASFEDVPPRPGDDLVAPTRAAILGTLLFQPLLNALFRTAAATRSARISEGLPLPAARSH